MGSCHKYFAKNLRLRPAIVTKTRPFRYAFLMLEHLGHRKKMPQKTTAYWTYEPLLNTRFYPWYFYATSWPRLVYSWHMMHWNYREERPLGPLSQHIDCIWAEDFCAQEGVSEHHIVPDNSVELIFTTQAMQRQLPTEPAPRWVRSHLVGLKTRPQSVLTSSSPLLGIRFKPQGLYPFLQGEVKDSVDQCLLPEEAFGSGIQALESQIAEAASFEERKTLALDYFNRELQQGEIQVDYLFEALLEAMNQSKGSLTVQALSQRFGVSVKTVERRFSTYLGLTPKKYALSLRIIEALKIARTQKAKTLVHTAHQFGFFDQAHFIKEVKKYTGLIPKDFAQRDMGVQLPMYQA